MECIDHGFGVVEFPAAVKDIDDAVVDEWLSAMHSLEPECHRAFSLAPTRYSALLCEPLPEQRKTLIESISSSLLSAVSTYANLYPGAGKCITWRADRHVVVYSKGCHIGPHNDNAIDSYSRNDELVGSTVSSSLVLSEKYTGGRIGFVLQEIELDPQKGSIVLFPSSFMGTHYITEVMSGSRVVHLEWFGHGKRSGNVQEIQLEQRS